METPQQNTNPEESPDFERLSHLCHSYYQSHTFREAQQDECVDLWYAGAARDGELRSIGLPNTGFVTHNPEHSTPKGTTMEPPQKNTKREICTITFISDESQHIDVIVTSHPNGNDLEKLAKSVLEALQALMQRKDPQHKETLNAANFDRG